MKIALSQLAFVDPKLRGMALAAEASFRVEFEVTSLFRIGDTGVHGTMPLRGIDLGCKVQAFGDLVAAFINDRWTYDPTRPEKMCCTCHATNNGGLHLHLQSHPNTMRIRRYG